MDQCCLEKAVLAESCHHHHHHFGNSLGSASYVPSGHDATMGLCDMLMRRPCLLHLMYLRQANKMAACAPAQMLVMVMRIVWMFYDFRTADDICMGSLRF